MIIKMKTLYIKRAAVSAIIVWVLGNSAYITSYYYPVMADPDVHAFWDLSVVMIPAASFGAHIYYRKGYQTNGFLLGIILFLAALTLDVLITVPFFIMPYGGTYISFFLDPGFWFLGIEYVSVVAAYWQLKRILSIT